MKPRLLKNIPFKASDPKTPSRFLNGHFDKPLSKQIPKYPEPARLPTCPFCKATSSPSLTSPLLPPSSKFPYKDIQDQSTIPNVTTATLASLTGNSQISKSPQSDPLCPLQTLSSRLLRRTIAGCSESFAHVVNNIVESKRGKDLIDFYETAIPRQSTLLSRFYRISEFPAKLQIIHKFCKFVFVFPKLYNLVSFAVIRKYIHLRRRKREKTMRKILEEINDSNMNLLSLDYVIFCESTCFPMDLKHFAKNRTAVNKATRLGSMCLGFSDSSMQLGLLQCPVDSTHRLPGLPFETEESTILGGHDAPKDQNSFVDAVLFVDRPDLKQGRVPVKQSFNVRRSELKLPFTSKKPVKSVYSSYKNPNNDFKKPQIAPSLPKGVVYQRKETPKDPYKTRSDNENGHSASKRQIRIPDYFKLKNNKSSSHREIKVTPVRFALGTNKLITASARTIQVKQPHKMTLTPIGETGPEAAQNESSHRTVPLTTSEPFRGLNGSFKQSSLITPYLQSDSVRRSGTITGPGTRLPSEKSIKLSKWPIPSKRPALNKKSIEEYQEGNTRTLNGGVSPNSSPDSNAKLSNSISPFGVYPIPLDKASNFLEATAPEGPPSNPQPKQNGDPATSKQTRDVHRFAIRPRLKTPGDSKWRLKTKDGHQTKSSLRNQSSKSGHRFLSSTFQLIAPSGPPRLSKQSFAGKGESKTYTNLGECENDRNSKQVSRDGSRTEAGRTDFSSLMTRLRMQRGIINA